MARVIGTLFTLVALGAVVLWAIGALLSDRYLWSQYLSWAPGWLIISITAALLVMAWILYLPGRAHAGPSRLLLVTSVAWLAALLYVGGFQLRIMNRWRAADSSTSFRILHWNVSRIGSMEPMVAVIERENPDIVVLNNPSPRLNWEPLVARFGQPVLLDNRIMVLSKAPIRRSGSTELNLEDVPAETPFELGTPRPHDPGRALFAEVELLPEHGGTLTLWALDLPSEWRKSRRRIALNAARTIGAWEDTAALAENGGDRTAHGFPQPDIVVGDFNIPRGAYSLSRLLPRMTHAFDQAGTGRAGTFPQTRPWLHIDHTFLAAGFRAVSYRIVDPGTVSTHRVQVVDIEPTPRDR